MLRNETSVEKLRVKKRLSAFFLKKNLNFVHFFWKNKLEMCSKISLEGAQRTEEEEKVVT